MTRPRRVPQARLGNTLGVAGVAFGVASTVCSQWLAGATAAGLAGVGGIAAAGAGSGLAIASRVGPTELPQTVAGFHSLVGAAAVATAVGEFLHLAPLGLLTPVSIGAIVAATYLGAITTTGARASPGRRAPPLPAVQPSPVSLPVLPPLRQARSSHSASSTAPSALRPSRCPSATSSTRCSAPSRSGRPRG